MRSHILLFITQFVLTKDVLVGVALSVLGAALGLASQVLYESAVIRKARLPIFGSWLCAYQPTIASGWDWVTEELVIRRWFGKIVLKNQDNSWGHEWEGTARLVDRKFLLGQWRATNMQAHGAFCLAFGFEESYMVGFFFAPDIPEMKVASAFVLGRTARHVELAKGRLALLRPMLSQKNLGM